MTWIDDIHHELSEAGLVAERGPFRTCSTEYRMKFSRAIQQLYPETDENSGDPIEDANGLNDLTVAFDSVERERDAERERANDAESDMELLKEKLRELAE